jgi:hypothetical protein
MTENFLSVIEINTVAPDLQLPSDQIVEATDINTIVDPGQATARDVFGNPLLPQSSPAGPFPLGTHEITWVVEDRFGNSTSSVQTITVVDTQAPVFGQAVSILEFADEPLALDLEPPVVTDVFPVTISNDAPSLFPPGTTLVTWQAIDPSGNTSHVQQLVEVAGLDIEVDPAEWIESTPLAEVLIRGTVLSPRNTGILVNGKVADMDYTTFPYPFMQYASLDPGENTISIEALSIGGLQNRVTFVITRDGDEEASPYEIELLNHSGIAPFDAEYEISGLGNGIAETLYYDFEGDGVYDLQRDVSGLQADDVYVLSARHAIPGVYNPSIVIEEAGGGSYRYDFLIRAGDGNSYVGIGHDTWDGLHERLLAGDASGAERFMSEKLAGKYRDAIRDIMPDFPEIVSSYSFFDAIEVRPRLMSFLLNRIEGGEETAYLVYFAQGPDGVWKLVSM